MFRNPVTLFTGYGWYSYDELREMSYAPHNTYLKVFFELGAIGLLLVLASFSGILRIAKYGMQKLTPKRRNCSPVSSLVSSRSLSQSSSLT